MGIREVDLTLESVFAGPDHPNDLIRGHWHYHKANAPDDARDKIFNTDKQHGIFPEAYLIEVECNIYLGDEQDNADSNAADYFYKVFGEYPQWFIDISPYALMGTEYDNKCDRCGVEVNLLNKSRYHVLCTECDNSFEPDGEIVL